MQGTERKTWWRPLLICFLAALLVHLQLIFTDLLPFLNRLFPREAPELKSNEVNLVSLPKNQWELKGLLHAPKAKTAMRMNIREEQKKTARLTPAPEETKIQKPEEKKTEKLDGQVVDVAPTPDSREPKNARFLSEHNTNVEKESVSRFRRPDYGVAQPRPTVAGFSRRSTNNAVEVKTDQEIALLLQKQGKRDGTGDAQGSAMEIPDVQKRDSLQLKLDLKLGSLASYEASEEVRGNSDRLRLTLDQKGQGDGSLKGEEGQDDQSVALFKKPTRGALDMVTGAPANDHIKGVPEGDETMLNTREFKFATFFNRVKRGVSKHWNPGETYMRHDPYGNVYGIKDRYTLLEVELDASGALKDVSVSHSCGLAFLDDEAISAFQNASPFPNPPQGLLDDKGMVHFQFGFFFEIGDRSGFRIMQSNQPGPFMY